MTSMAGAAVVKDFVLYLLTSSYCGGTCCCRYGDVVIVCIESDYCMFLDLLLAS